MRDYPEHFSCKDNYSTNRVLYQFQGLKNEYLETIYDNELFISNPNNFNDPFDCWGAIDINAALQLESEELARFLVKFSKGNYSVNNILEVNKKAPAELKQLLSVFDKNMNKVISEHINCSCFTSAWDNELMWSHYADKHKGICLGFDLSQWNNLKGYQFGPVQYKAQKPINLLELFNDDLSSFSQKTAHQLIFTKNPDWHYEKEWRLATPKLTNNKIPLSNLGLSVKEVIFGFTISLENALKQKRLFIEKGINVDFYKIKLGDNISKLQKIAI